MTHDTHAPCSGYRPEAGPGVCRHGFMQTPGCYMESRIPPWCLRDELPEHWIDDGGLPIFKRDAE